MCMVTLKIGVLTRIGVLAHGPDPRHRSTGEKRGSRDLS